MGKISFCKINLICLMLRVRQAEGFILQILILDKDNHFVSYPKIPAPLSPISATRSYPVYLSMFSLSLYESPSVNLSA